MTTISWPEPQKYPVNLHSVIPGWMIYFNDEEKIAMYYLHEQYILDGVKVTPSPRLLSGRVSKVHSFLSKIAGDW